jgi:NADH-quinone oxidoreductase subunit H
VLALDSAAFGAAPFGQYLIAADLDVGILFSLALGVTIAIALVGSGSFFAGVHAAIRTIAFATPAAVAIVCIVMMTGSIRLQEIIAAQGATPWEWYAFKSPVTLGLFALYVGVAALSPEPGRAQGEIPADSPPLVRARPLLVLADWANVLVTSSVATALFLGGWRLPGVGHGELEARPWLELLASAVFLAKAWLVAAGALWARATLLRARAEDVLRLVWARLLPLSGGAAGLTYAWTAWRPAEFVQRGVAAGTFVLFCLFVARFLVRVRFHARAAEDAHLNPFL